MFIHQTVRRNRSEFKIVKAENREGTQSITLSSLKPNTTYSYCASIDYEGGPVNGEMKEFTTKGDDDRWVDLGLSVLWAAYNVGASSPEEYGDHYAWGETSVKSEYTEENYKYYGKYYTGSGPDSWFWQGTFIGNEISGTSYDVAYMKWGVGVKMPTLTQIQELIDNCTISSGTYKEVSGSYVTGPNGNSIFLPFTGNRSGDQFGFVGSYGHYWTGTYGGDIHNGCCAYVLSIGKDKGWWYSNVARSYGFSVRPVRDK